MTTAPQWDLTQELTPHDAAVRRDRATQLALTLAQELWVVKDRLLVLEAALSAEGKSLREVIDRHQPDAATRAAIATMIRENRAVQRAERPQSPM